MSVFKLSRSDKIFAIKASIISIITIISIILLYKFVMSDSRSVETKKAHLNLSQHLNRSEVVLRYELRCINGLPKSHQCNKKYFTNLINLLEDKNILSVKNGVYVNYDIDFILHYYAGPPTPCIEKACQEFVYYIQLDIQYNDDILPEMSLKYEYEIVNGKNNLSTQEQIDKIEEIGPLKFEQTEKFLKFLSELSQEKQKALVK